MLLEYLRNHQRFATVIAVLLAAAVTVFLFVLSSTGGEKGTDDSISATAAISPASGGDLDDDVQGLLTSEEAAGRQLLAPEHLDVDGDGQAEVLVMAQGEGEDRLLDWYLYGYKEGQLVRLFARTGVVRGELSLDRPGIEEREALYAPGDPACCPSAFVVSHYSWENGDLVLMDRTKVPAL